MSYKKININRENIAEAIKSLDVDYEVEIKNESTFEKYIIKKNDQTLSKLNIYATPDGKTTISWQECKNPIISENIAKHIVENCKYPDVLNTSIYIEKLDQSKLQKLIEFLTVYCGAEIINEKNLTNGKQFKVKSVYGDIVYLNHYKTNSFNVQGTNGLMKSQVVEGLSAYLDYSEVVEATLKSYKIENTNLNDIHKLFNARLPIANNEISDTIKGIILPVIVLERLNIDDELITDYSFQVFPIFRGLEGCIREIFLKHSISLDNKIGLNFEQKIKNAEFTLLERNKNIINDVVVVKVLEKFYNYHKSNRHAIFHVDDTIITTKIITDKKVAQSLINETFELIEICYIAMKQNDIKLLK